MKALSAGQTQVVMLFRVNTQMMKIKKRVKKPWRNAFEHDIHGVGPLAALYQGGSSRTC